MLYEVITNASQALFKLHGLGLGLQIGRIELEVERPVPTGILVAEHPYLLAGPLRIDVVHIRGRPIRRIIPTDGASYNFV